MKKLLLSTLILTSGLMQAFVPLNKSNQPSPAIAAATAAAGGNNQVIKENNPYTADLENIDKEIQEAAKKGNINPTESQENALKKLSDKLGSFINDYCPKDTQNKFTLNQKITLDAAIATLDKFESLATKIHADLSKNDSYFAVIYPKWYSAKAKDAHRVITNIRLIKNDLNPSNYFVRKFKDGSKWALNNKTVTVLGTLAFLSTSRFLFKDHNGWIKPLFNASSWTVNNAVLPVLHYASFDIFKGANTPVNTKTTTK